ncbi:MAG: hypothetical protein Q4C10_14440, partial [Clostridia bacterium]|nr:hypothetical protein [Clostridia bacterium]
CRLLHQSFYLVAILVTLGLLLAAVILSLIVSLFLPPFCLLCFSCLCHQIVDLPAPEYLPKESIVLVLLPQDGVFLFEPVIAPSQTFIVLVQLSVCLIEPIIAVLHLEIPHQEAFYELFQPFYKGLRKLGLVGLGRHESLQFGKLILRIVFQLIFHILIGYLKLSELRTTEMAQHAEEMADLRDRHADELAEERRTHQDDLIASIMRVMQEHAKKD